MQTHVLNFKRFESGAMVGFFDLAVGPLVVSGCKAFRKQAEDVTEKLWFAWPSQKAADKDGNEVWNDIVTAAPPVARHLQALVRPQVRRLLDGKEHADRRVEEARQVFGSKLLRSAKGSPPRKVKTCRRTAADRTTFPSDREVIRKWHPEQL